ncbi:MAG: hypothetical protein COT74_14140 [Bdellovibrionales bacterium CG10_big_fil_rev_8_21_14_0_10_45_34]|nr:MAG: hypothetical protein COT74_14140 [Bdellovibrionales bacterium CG10_big_fil_rev_8_21_14_0_10_45_34]
MRKLFFFLLMCFGVSAPGQAGQTYKFEVEGMTCGGCSSNIEKKVSELEFVESVKADYKTNTAIVTHKASAAFDEIAVAKAIESAGYKVKEGTKATLVQ